MTRLAVRGRILYERLAAGADTYHDDDAWIHVNAFSKSDVPIELAYTHPMHLWFLEYLILLYILGGIGFLRGIGVEHTLELRDDAMYRREVLDGPGRQTAVERGEWPRRRELFGALDAPAFEFAAQQLLELGDSDAIEVGDRGRLRGPLRRCARRRLHARPHCAGCAVRRTAYGARGIRSGAKHCQRRQTRLRAASVRFIPIKNRNFRMNEKIAVIGLGYVGLPVAVAFARSGVAVIGFDIDRKRVDELRRRALRQQRHLVDRQPVRIKHCAAPVRPARAARA